MIVDRVEYRSAERQELQVLLHDVDVVAVWIEHRERDAAAFVTVVPVIVVDAEGGGTVGLRAAAMPRVSVVLPAALSPAMASMTGSPWFLAAGTAALELG